MKMTQEHYKKLESAIQDVLKDNPTYLQDNESNVTPMRLRWSLFWMAHDKKENNLFIRSLSDYCDDNNIDTALRRIIETIKKGS